MTLFFFASIGEECAVGLDGSVVETAEATAADIVPPAIRSINQLNNREAAGCRRSVVPSGRKKVKAKKKKKNV